LSVVSPGEARAVVGAWSSASWWAGVVRARALREPGRVMAGVVKRWAVSVMRGLGYRVYQARSGFDEDVAGVVVKGVGRGGYRVLYAGVAGVEKVKISGGKYLVALGSLIVYGWMGDKNASFLDPFKPRMRRVYNAKGYIITAAKRNVIVASEGLRWSDVVKCSFGEARIRESQSRWIVFVPPLILWKWYYWVEAEPLWGEPVEDVCPMRGGDGGGR